MKTIRGGMRAGSRAGFTLIELSIVLAILGILYTITVPIGSTVVRRAREAALRTELFTMRDAIDKHFADHGKYPDSLPTLVEKEYLRALPVDPFTRSRDSWTTAPSSASEPDVWDVHSGAEDVGLDGTPVKDW